MKRLLVLAALSLAAVAETAAEAPAWWPCLGCCHSGSCNKCSFSVCCRPYNAFSPCCSVNVSGNLNCLGGCRGGAWGGCGNYGPRYAAPTWGGASNDCGGCDSCSGWDNSTAGVQPFCPVPPMPFAAPASVAAACGNQGHAGKCGFWGRLHRRVAVEPAPNGCNAFYPGFSAGCEGCGDNQTARHHHHRRGESWWARFSRQQLCCPANADGVMEYTCGGCNSGCDNGCDGSNIKPTPAPTPARPATPPKPLPRKTTQAITPQDLGTGLSVLQDPIGQN